MLHKETILDCLTKMIIDHSIIIETEKLRAKINILFEDCKDMTDAEFMEVSERLRKGELYGKLPASKDFLETKSPKKFAQYQHLLK